MAFLVPPSIGDYTFVEIVEHCNFSIIAIATTPKNPEYLACKIYPKAVLVANNLQERFTYELNIHKKFHHIGIVQFFEVIEDESNFYIFMEYCSKGTFSAFLTSPLPEPMAAHCIYQILQALQYIHSFGIAHRDLKPENILIDGNGHLKISDFGLSIYVDDNGLVSTPCGTIFYTSPECLSGHPYDGLKSDIWSCGIILYASLMRKLPWTERKTQKLYNQIKHGQFSIPSTLSSDCRSLLAGLLNIDPTQRLTIEQALQHPFLKNISSLESEYQHQISNALKTVLQHQKITVSDPKFNFSENISDIHGVTIKHNAKAKKNSSTLKVLLPLSYVDKKSTTQNNKPSSRSKRSKTSIVVKKQEDKSQGKLSNTTNSIKKHPDKKQYIGQIVPPSYSMQNSVPPFLHVQPSKKSVSLKPALLRKHIPIFVKPRQQ